MKTTKLTNTLTLIKDDRNGLSIKSSKTGLSYELLEGCAICGKSSSDIIFIMVGTDDIGYLGLLNYQFGADYVECEIEDLATEIENFENGKSDEYKMLEYNSCTPVDDFESAYCNKDSEYYGKLTDEQIKIIKKIVYNKK